MMKKKQAKKTDKTDDKNKETSTTQAGGPLTIPQGNFVATVGEGFAGHF